MKSALVRSQAERLARINAGDVVVVGRNRWTDGLPSPLLGGDDGGLFRVDPKSAAETLEMLRATKSRRNQAEVDAALRRLRDAAVGGQNLMPLSIECARARVTTGEWAETLRAGVRRVPAGHRRRGPAARPRERPRRGGARAGRGVGGRARHAAAHRRRQAGARRPLERLRDDRGGRASTPASTSSTAASA